MICRKWLAHLAMWVVLCGIFVPHSVAQEHRDSSKVRQLPAVTIGGDYYKATNPAVVLQAISVKQLNNLPALQLADVIKFLSGVVVKDYGGTGGMKTVSVRGLGSQHTGVAYDGIALSDCQTGQIDLGKLSLDNVSSISMNIGEVDLLMPARLFSYSNLISVRTIQTIPSKPFHVRVSFTGGLYGLWSPSLFVENLLKSGKRNDRYVIWNLSASYLHSRGDYPYLLHYGGAQDSVSRERRTNADVSAFTAEANVLYKHDANRTLRLKGYLYDSERGLPSATIFYSHPTRQRLSNRNGFAQVSYQQRFSPQWTYLVNGKFNYDHTYYVDPDYHNSAGRLDNIYEQYEGYLSNVVKFSPFYKHDGWTICENPTELHFALANDVFYNLLDGNSMEYDRPTRLTTQTALSMLYFNKVFQVSGNLLFTTAHNAVGKQAPVRDFYHLSPTVNFSANISKQLHIRALYKNIFRLPTFNDLYYREVGNRDLEPEKTHQWNLGLTFRPQRFARGKMDFSAALDGYFNIVKDKIVAFPSGNLFSWTMLNYGKVWVAGAELNANWQYQFVRHYFLRVNGNCSYQKAIDRTNPGDRSFNCQIPYTPVWSGSSSVSLETPWFTVAYSLVASGERYALPENSTANRVEGYVDQSITLGHEFPVKAVKLGVKAELLNLANTHYEIVKNYPMQGRSFRIKVWFSY